MTIAPSPRAFANPVAILYPRGESTRLRRTRNQGSIWSLRSTTISIRLYLGRPDSWGDELSLEDYQLHHLDSRIWTAACDGLKREVRRDEGERERHAAWDGKGKMRELGMMAVRGRRRSCSCLKHLVSRIIRC